MAEVNTDFRVRFFSDCIILIFLVTLDWTIRFGLKQYKNFKLENNNATHKDRAYLVVS